MPIFTNRPPEPDRPKNWKLIRTPAKTPLRALVLSDDIVGCNTHFWGGRTVPCEGPHCPACADGSPTRWHGYIAIWLPPDNIRLLFEFTDGPAELLAQYRAANGTLRGCKIEASRIKPVPNARVLLKTSRIDLSKYPLPDAPDICKMLLQMWELPGKAFDSPAAAADTKNLQPIAPIIKRMRGLPPDKDPAPTKSKTDRGESAAKANGTY